MPKLLKSFLQTIKIKRREHRFKKAKAALKVMIERKDQDIYDELHQIAQTMANGMVMSWLDGKRINHCHRCPMTAPLLKNSENRWICKDHFDREKIMATAA